MEFYYDGWQITTRNEQTLKEIHTPAGHRIVLQSWDERRVNPLNYVTRERSRVILWVPELGKGPCYSFEKIEACREGFAAAGLGWQGGRSESRSCGSVVVQGWHEIGFRHWEKSELDSDEGRAKILAAVDQVLAHLPEVDQAIEAVLDATTRKMDQFEAALSAR